MYYSHGSLYRCVSLSIPWFYKTVKDACIAEHLEIIKDCSAQWKSQGMSVSIKTLTPNGPMSSAHYNCVAEIYVEYKNNPESLPTKSVSDYGQVAGPVEVCPKNGILPKSLSDISEYPSEYPDPIHGECPTSCPVEPLKPITDPDALRFENGDRVREDKLNPSMKTKLACLRAAVTKAGGTLTLQSAWRPMAYQDHLREIFDKMTALDDNMKNPACVPVRNEIEKHRVFHGVAVKQTKADGLLL